MSNTKSTNHKQDNSEKENLPNDPENVTEALKQAEKDIEKDADLNNEPDPAADLDEGELARLESEK